MGWTDDEDDDDDSDGDNDEEEEETEEEDDDILVFLVEDSFVFAALFLGMMSTAMIRIFTVGTTSIFKFNYDTIYSSVLVCVCSVYILVKIDHTALLHAETEY